MSASTKRPRLKMHLLGNDSQRKCKEMIERPVKVLQIGEGNFYGDSQTGCFMRVLGKANFTAL